MIFYDPFARVKRFNLFGIREPLLLEPKGCTIYFVFCTLRCQVKLNSGTWHKTLLYAECESKTTHIWSGRYLLNLIAFGSFETKGALNRVFS